MLDDGSKPMSIRRQIKLPSDGPATSQFELADGSEWRPPTESELARIPAVYYLKPRTGALQESFNPSKENNIYSLIREWMPPALQKESQLHKLMRNYAPNETNLSAYVRFFENEVLGPLRLAFPPDIQLQRYLNPDFRTPKDKGRLFVRELTHAGAKEALIRLPLDHHGTGLISVVAMVLSVAVLNEYHRQELSGKPMVIAIEEPEVHLHAHAQRTLLQYFRILCRQHQLIVATHSAILVDRADPTNVVVLRRATQKDEKGSKRSSPNVKVGTTLAISGAYRENWRDIKELLGLRLSDSLMVGEVNLLVEGATEAVLLPAMAEVWAEANQSVVDFGRVLLVNGEGGNMPHLARLLQSTGNPTLVLVDGDKGGDDIFRKIEKQGASVEVLARPGVSTLRHPVCLLKQFEFEDLLDEAALLEAFNIAFAGNPGFEFLPLNFEEFSAERMRIIGRGDPSFGWIATIESLINKKTVGGIPTHHGPSKQVNKRLLAESAARLVREKTLPVPAFCEQIFRKIQGLLEK